MKFLICTILPFSILIAQEDVSNAELSRKLDLILGKIGGLEERVTKLETNNVEVKKEVKEVAKSAKEAKTATENLSFPKDVKEKKSFLENLRINLKSDELKTNKPWTQKTKWTALKKNMTSYQVRKLLGNPNTIKSSLNPRIEQIYRYYGDINADGVEEEAEVNIFRDRVVSFTTPFQ